MNIPLFLITFTQVVTESLPISSSSHLRLVGYLLTLGGVEMPTIVFSAQWESFEHLLHIPTVVVVALVMWKQRAALYSWTPGLRPGKSRLGDVVSAASQEGAFPGASQESAFPDLSQEPAFPGLTRDPEHKMQR